MKDSELARPNESTKRVAIKSRHKLLQRRYGKPTGCANITQPDENANRWKWPKELSGCVLRAVVYCYLTEYDNFFDVVCRANG